MILAHKHPTLGPETRHSFSCQQQYLTYFDELEGGVPGALGHGGDRAEDGGGKRGARGRGRAGGGQRP